VSGGLVGGTVGFNYQLGSIVLGLEGDIDWSGISGSGSCVAGTLSCQTTNDWLGTARGRIGYAFNQVLPYVTGGAAFGNLRWPGAWSGEPSNPGVTHSGQLRERLHLAQPEMIIS
jgi:outer membrane immunogenic protein